MIKSTEVHAILRRRLGPWFKSNGFIKNKRGGWSKALDDGTFVVYISLGKYPDEYAGSQFTLDLGTERPYLQPPERLPHLLSDAQLQEFQRIQMRVIARLRRPDSAYTVPMDPSTREYYNSLFEDPGPPSRGHDHWFRYAQAIDVEEWSDFILQVLAPAIGSSIEREGRQSQFPSIHFRTGPTGGGPPVHPKVLVEV